jgi:hypothetical protein
MAGMTLACAINSDLILLASSSRSNFDVALRFAGRDVGCAHSDGMNMVGLAGFFGGL